MSDPQIVSFGRENQPVGRTAKTWYAEPCLQKDTGVSVEHWQKLDHYMSQITKI